MGKASSWDMDDLAKASYDWLREWIKETKNNPHIIPTFLETGSYTSMKLNDASRMHKLAFLLNSNNEARLFFLSHDNHQFFWKSTYSLWRPSFPLQQIFHIPLWRQSSAASDSTFVLQCHRTRSCFYSPEKVYKPIELRKTWSQIAVVDGLFYTSASLDSR